MKLSFCSFEVCKSTRWYLMANLNKNLIVSLTFLDKGAFSHLIEIMIYF